MGEVATQFGFAPPGHYQIEDIQGAFRTFQALAGSSPGTEMRTNPKTVFETSCAELAL